MATGNEDENDHESSSLDERYDDNPPTNRHVGENGTSIDNQIMNTNMDENDDDGKFETVHNYTPREPDYTSANSLYFSDLVKSFEQLWLLKTKKQKTSVSKESKLKHLLPSKLAERLKGGSPFPILRLMTPDIDFIRGNFGMKDAIIAITWAEALGLHKNNPDYKRLIRYHDPNMLQEQNQNTMVGDLSMAVYEVVKKRYPVQENRRKITVEQINILLDELALLNRKNRTDKVSGAHDNQLNTTSSTITLKQKRIGWVETLLATNLSPLEHKWIVRIIMGKLDIGVSSESIINYYHPWSRDLFSANKNLQTLCTLLSDKDFMKRYEEKLKHESSQVENYNRQQYLPKFSGSAILYNTIEPMLCQRTSFESLLSDIQTKHKAYADGLSKDDPLRLSLALKFPTFLCEVKLDGERQIIHVKSGVVKTQSRRSTWYSNLYSPVLGPALRRALELYDIDVILDGEVIAWDDGRKEIIPFSNNQTVANYRRRWCRRNGLLDPIDLNLHDDDKNVLKVKVVDDNDDPISGNDENDPGCECWIKFVIFDILYIGGPDANRAICDTFQKLIVSAVPNAGSLLNYDLWQRRLILNQVIIQQENMIEIGEGVVIRSDGSISDAYKYFTPIKEENEFGMSPLVLDSINAILNGDIPDFLMIDKKRRRKRTDAKIEEERALCVQSFYDEIVGRRCLEGLVFKDLCTPYGLGSRFRNKGYWFKLKDDYSHEGKAADIDVVIVGASFASGMRNSGLINSFLCACIDPEYSMGGICKYMTFCYVAGPSNDNLAKLLELTGYSLCNNAVNYGKWFPGDEAKTIPNFISTRSFQSSMTSDDGGWKCKKDYYPDVWIDPEDSFVFTLVGGEIVSSKDHSAGVTLRFPRISKIRAEGFDGDIKAPCDVESVVDLHDRFFDVQALREGNNSISSNNVTPQQSSSSCRFLTAEQHLKSSRGKRKRVTSAKNLLPFIPSLISSLNKTESYIFRDCTFVILEGNYQLDTLDRQQAMNEGWYIEASRIKGQQDVIDFILKNGGTVKASGQNDEIDFIIGGRKDDARVVNFRKVVDNTLKTNMALKKKTKKGETLIKNVKNHGRGAILRWTFIFEIRNQILRESETDSILKDCISIESSSDHSLRSLYPHFLNARRLHDYLVISKFDEENLLRTQDEYGIHHYEDTNLVDFKRAMMMISDKLYHDPVRSSIPWQFTSEILLEDDEKLVLLNKSNRCSLFTDIVLYPDLFELGDFGLNNIEDANKEILNGSTSTRWENIAEDRSLCDVASSLPLVRAMGARVVPHLCDGVTHVLCDLQDCEKVIWNQQQSESLFRYSLRGREIQSRLLQLHGSREQTEVILVSSGWVIAQWSLR